MIYERYENALRAVNVTYLNDTLSWEFLFRCWQNCKVLGERSQLDKEIAKPNTLRAVDFTLFSKLSKNNCILLAKNQLGQGPSDGDLARH